MARIGSAGANQNRTSEGHSWKWIFGPSAQLKIYGKLLLDTVVGHDSWTRRQARLGTPCPMKKTSVRLTGFYQD